MPASAGSHLPNEGKFKIEAMAGINLYSESAGGSKRGAASPTTRQGEPCIFISHRKDDIRKAREVGRYLKELNLNIYLDEEDKELQKADLVGDHASVVAYIDGALDACTHFLGIITPNTRGSWWVPYELGMARRAQRECAHLIEGTVNELPSFIQVAEILPDVVSLKKWLAGVGRSVTRKTFDAVYEERMQKVASPPEFIPEKRPKSELKFR
jgi:hypothetical protein